MATQALTTFLNQTVVQTAVNWPGDTGGWTTITAWARNVINGLANDVGSAEFYHPAGQVILPGTIAMVNIVPLDIVGQYVRILKASATGTAYTDSKGKRYNVLWYGKVVSRQWQPNSDQTGLDVVYTAAGILSVLDQIVPFMHLEAGQGTTTNNPIPCDITMSLAINERGGKKSTNRSDATVPVGDRSVYIFDRSSFVNRWTARQYLDYLLALIQITNPGGPRWSINDPAHVLDYTDKWDLTGMNVLEQISRLCNPRHAIGFVVGAVNGPLITIYVYSLAKDAINVSYPYSGEGATTFALPATTPYTLDLTDNSELLSFTINEHQQATYDKIGIVGGADIYICSLGFNPGDKDGGAGNSQLVRYWNDQDETLFDTAETYDAEDPDTFRFQGAVSRTYLRFKIVDNWNGTDYLGNVVLPHGRNRAANALHGDGGYDGELGTAADIPARLNGGKMCVMRDLQIPAGYDWDTQDPAQVDLTERPMAPKVFVYKPGSNTMQTLESYCDGRSAITVEIDEDVGAITLGPAEIATDIQAAIADGYTIVVTLAVKHWLPLMVSWNRPAADDVPVSDQPRSLIRMRSEATRKTIIGGTVFRALADKGYSRVGDTPLYSDVGFMKSILALAVAWYSEPDWEISWGKRGVIDETAGVPGNVYTTVIHRDGAGGTITKSISAVVTRQELDFADGTGGTRISTKRIQFDVETVF